MNIAELKANAATIKNATAVHENTALIVGGLFENIIERIDPPMIDRPIQNSDKIMAVKNDNGDAIHIKLIDFPFAKSTEIVGKGEVYNLKTLLPFNNFQDIGTAHSSETVFVNNNLIRINTDFISHIIYKTAPVESVNIYHVYKNIDGTLSIRSTENIILDESWLDASYGSEVYKIPYNKAIVKGDTIGLKEFYFKLTNGTGWETVPTGVLDPFKEIGLGLIYKDYSLFVTKEEFIAAKEILPINNFNSIDTAHSSDTVFLNANMFSINTDFVAYIIYKECFLNQQELNIFHCYRNPDNGISIRSTENIKLNASWLDASYGSGVYKIPYNKAIRKGYSIGLKDFKFCMSGGWGYIAEPTGGVEPGRELAYGLIYKDCKTLLPSYWAGKKINFLGDSITYMGLYMAEYISMTDCIGVNYGISGATIAANEGHYCFCDMMENMDSDADMVVVFGGTNDFGMETDPFASFGTFGEGVNKYTFYGALHYLYRGLKIKYYNKPIIIMTPLHRYGPGPKEFIIGTDGSITYNTNPKTGKTMMEYINAIKEVAAYYGFPILDLHSTSGLAFQIELDSANLSNDGLHPNEQGARRIAKVMYSFLENINY